MRLATILVLAAFSLLLLAGCAWVTVRPATVDDCIPGTLELVDGWCAVPLEAYPTITPAPPTPYPTIP